jgi:hypothetical protein
MFPISQSRKYLFPLSSVLAFPWLLLGLTVNGCAAQSEPLDPTVQAPTGLYDNLVTYWPVALETGTSRCTSPSPRR